LPPRAKAARKYAKMTQRQAEAASGVKQASISKIERGDTTRTIGLLALARVYRADPTGSTPATARPPGTRCRSANRRTSVNEPAAPLPGRAAVPPEVPCFAPGTPDTVPLISWSQVAKWEKTAR
jgi:transcriptional regulator with XRE-family HTH domain